VAVGPAPAAESYLVAERVLDAPDARVPPPSTPATASFGELRLRPRGPGAGLIFVGPSPEAMELMGGKDTAKEVMGRAGVPLVPGYHGADQSDARSRTRPPGSARRC
jgi:3-methylcrotonyl-CoA carboxylase alpha subunit